jgi:hypothetical protein
VTHPMQSEPRVRLHGRRHRGFTVPVLDGGPEIGSGLMRAALYDRQSAGGALIRRLLCMPEPA